jgi:hypothetical protein
VQREADPYEDFEVDSQRASPLREAWCPGAGGCLIGQQAQRPPDVLHDRELVSELLVGGTVHEAPEPGETGFLREHRILDVDVQVAHLD